MRASLLFVAVLALGAVSLVSARSSLRRAACEGAHASVVDAPHPDQMEEYQAVFARAREELEARNYSLPLTASPNGGKGVDVSSFGSKAVFECLKKSGHSFVGVRAFQETCEVDPNGVHTVANAWAAGMKHVDIYLYPSYHCGVSAAGQVDKAIDSMGKTPFGKLWMDIEEGGNAGPTADNAWLKAATEHAVKRIGAKRVGIYSSAYGWQVNMGSHSGYEKFPIWYAHYDNNPSFSDWKGFAGWKKPAMKQYAGSTTVCSMGVDLNYF